MTKLPPFELNLYGIVIGTLLTFGSILIGMGVWGIPMPSNVEILAVWTSYVCTFLCVFQSRTNYYWGIVTVALYAYLFWSGSLYASAATQVYLSGALLYGWWRWGPDAATRPVRSTPLRLYPAYILVTVVVWAGAMLLSEQLGGAVPFWDGWILAGTILAQFLLDNKRIETWIVWVAVNIVSIWIYYEAGFMLVVVQYVLFLANTLWGFHEWHKSMVEDQAEAYSEDFAAEMKARERSAP